MNILFWTILLCTISENTLHFGESGNEHNAAKIFLHIDREVYRPGEQILFKAYLTDAASDIPLTNTIQIELVRADANVNIIRKTLLTESTGNSYLKLPDSLPSGGYVIRAFPAQNKNNFNLPSFQKEITVINSESEYEQLSINPEDLLKRIKISFFPECGYMVDSVMTAVAFKVEDESGKGFDVTLKLFTDSGNLVTEFNSFHLGMGRFSIIPLPEYRYYAVVKDKDGRETGSDLPRSLPTGITMSTAIKDNNILSLILRTNNRTLSSLSGKLYKAAISTENVIKKVINVRPDSLITNYLIPLDSLPHGILRITLSDDNGTIICERLIYNQKNKDILLSIQTDKVEYKPFEKVNVQISLSGDSSYSGKAKLSLSAADSRVTSSSTAFTTSAVSWLFLESGIQGPVEAPGWYFNLSNRYRFQFIDLLLMTQKLPDLNSGYKTLNGFIFEKQTSGGTAFGPDMFGTIHWEPDINISSKSIVNLSFLNTSQTGIKIISVEGITEDGIPLTARIIYSVK
jgi:hypothetical protein